MIIQEVDAAMKEFPATKWNRVIAEGLAKLIYLVRENQGVSQGVSIEFPVNTRNLTVSSDYTGLAEKVAAHLSQEEYGFSSVTTGQRAGVES